MSKRSSLGLPELQFYYDTAKLVNILCLSSGVNLSTWMQLEDAYSYVIPLLDVNWQSEGVRSVRLFDLDSVSAMFMCGINIE